MPTAISLVGQTYGNLTVIDTAPSTLLSNRWRTQWKCRCSCGAEVTARGDFLRVGAVRSCGNRRKHPAMRKSVPDSQKSYMTAHDRVRKVKGKASAQKCVDCGGPAAHWSYNHRDPQQIVTESGTAYSFNPDYYEARCVTDHRIFDAKRTEVCAR